MITQGIIKLVPIKNIENINVTLEEHKIEQIKQVIYLEKDFSKFYSTLIPVVVLECGNDIYRTYFGHEIVCVIKEMCPDFEKQTQLERKYMSVLVVKTIKDAKLIVSNFISAVKNQLINFIIDDSFTSDNKSKESILEVRESEENQINESTEGQNNATDEINSYKEVENSSTSEIINQTVGNIVEGRKTFYVIKSGSVRKIQKLNKTYLNLLPTTISEKIKELKLKNVGKDNVDKIRELIIKELSQYGDIVETNEDSLINQTIEDMKQLFAGELNENLQKIDDTNKEIYIPYSFDYKEKQKINKQYLDILPNYLAKDIKSKKIKNVGKGVNLLYDEIFNTLSKYFNVVRIQNNDDNKDKIEQTINFLSKLKTEKVKLVPNKAGDKVEVLNNCNPELSFNILVPKGKKVFNLFAKNNPDFVRQTLNNLPNVHQKVIKSDKIINWRRVKSESEKIIEIIIDYLSKYAPVIINEVEYVNGASWTEESINLLQNIDVVFESYHKDKSLLELSGNYPISFWKKYAESTPEEIDEFLKQVKNNVYAPLFLISMPIEFPILLEKTSDVDPQELIGMCDSGVHLYKILKNYKLLQPLAKGGLKQFISNTEQFLSAYTHVAKFGVEREFISILENYGEFKDLDVQMFYLKLHKTTKNNLPNTSNVEKIWECLKDKTLVLC